MPCLPTTILTASERSLRILLLTLAIGGAFVSVALLVIKVQNQNPQIIPPPRNTVPARNSFDVLKSVGKQIVHPDEVSCAVGAETARVPLLWTHSQKRALVAPNQAILDTACAALSLPYQEVPTETWYEQRGIYPQPLNSLARLMVLAGDVAREENRTSDAAEYYLSAITLGRHLPHDSALSGLVSGLVNESSGRDGLWKQWETMDQELTRRCLTTLESLQANRHPYYKNFETEKYMTQCAIRVAMDDPENADLPTWESINQRRYARTIITLESRQVIMKKLSDYMDKWIADAKRPYVVAKQKVARPDNTLFASLISPGFEHAYYLVAKGEAGDSLLRITLALRLYRMQTGHYPTVLSQLITAKIMKQLPTDPFDQSSSFHYHRLAADRFLLYSIGPDGDDDNGRGTGVENSTGLFYRYPSEDSDGDLVVGWYPY